jgi:hypothetical protein
VACAGGEDSLRLRPGAALRFLGSEGGKDGAAVESFLLKEGALEASTGSRTRLATAFLWVFPEKAGTRADYYAEAGDRGTAYFRAAGGSGLLRLALAAAGQAASEVHFGAGQGGTVSAGKDGTFRLATDPHNEWLRGQVRALRPLGDGLLDLYVPRATEVEWGPDPSSPGRVLVGNGAFSWRSGKVRLLAMREGVVRCEVDVSPGLACSLDPATGKGALRDPAGWTRPLPAPGDLLPLPAPARVAVRSFERSFAPRASRVRCVLANEGPPIEHLWIEVRFGFPGREGEPLPIRGRTAGAEVTDWKTGEERTLEVSSPLEEEAAVLALLRAFTGADAPATAPRESSDRGIRRGTLLLDRRVEVAEMKGDLCGAAPSLSFTLENVDGGRPGEPVGTLRYVLELWKGGRRIDLGPAASAPRPLPEPLGPAGARLVLEVPCPGGAAGVAGAKPVLRLTR